MGLEENYEKLAHEIIKQAAKDWRQAALRLKKNPRNRDALSLKAETERFFRSQWCYELGGIEGDVFLGRLQEEF